MREMRDFPLRESGKGVRLSESIFSESFAIESGNMGGEMESLSAFSNLLKSGRVSDTAEARPVLGMESESGAFVTVLRGVVVF